MNTYTKYAVKYEFLNEWNYLQQGTHSSRGIEFAALYASEKDAIAAWKRFTSKYKKMAVAQMCLITVTVTFG